MNLLPTEHRPPFKCECGNDTFNCRGHVSGIVDVVYRDNCTEEGEIVEVDAWELESDDNITDIDGPFRCTKCDREYEMIPPLNWTCDTPNSRTIHTDDEPNIFGGMGEVK